jgi:predicted deacylase
MHTRIHPLSVATPGNARHLTSFHYGPAGVGQKVYIQASLHADELPGMLVAHHLRLRLAELEAQGALHGEVVVVPVANPIGLSQRLLREPVGRFDLDSGENFNRHYAALTDAVWRRVELTLGADEQANGRLVRQALREAVAQISAPGELASMRRVLLQLACDADVVLDLHCDCEAVMHLYTGTPLWPQAEVLARCIGAQVSLLAECSGDEPFDEACSQTWWEIARRAGAQRPVPLGCLSATVELRGMADVSHELARTDAQALLDFLEQRGVLRLARTAPYELPALPREATPLAGSIPVEATGAGVVAWHCSPGVWVREGEVLGEVVDPIAGTAAPLVSGTDGFFYARHLARFATPGMRLAKIAGEHATRSGKLLGA